jgi:hypothetical protein
MSPEPSEIPYTDMTDEEVMRRILKQQLYQSKMLFEMNAHLREIKGHTGCFQAYLLVGLLLAAGAIALSIFGLVVGF